jgi:16S rRNA (cytosine967-C5)-methyltransferase
VLLSTPIQPVKLHKPLLNGIATSLALVFNEKRYTDKVLERLFKQNKQWGSRDRKFVAEAVYDIVRYYRLLSQLSQSKTNFWFMTSVYLVLKGIELPEWPEFKHVNKEQILKDYAKLKDDFLVFESYPDNLNALGEKELGMDAWREEAKAMNEPAEVVLRVNTLKITTEKLKSKLAEEKLETSEIEGLPNSLILKKRSNIFSSPSFQEGLFELQDAGSQHIGLYTNPQAKQLVVDACAGAGGKSLQLAAIMQNKGKIISMDVAQWKLEELTKRAKRAGANNIVTRLIEGDQTIEKLSNMADFVLLDVPCSGLGVLKRNPDAKWKFTTETFDKTRELQKKILNDYSKMAKPEGIVIYSTCSILPSENREQVDLFLKNNPNFEFIEDKTILPSQGFDGFYMCKLKKKAKL